MSKLGDPAVNALVEAARRDFATSLSAKARDLSAQAEKGQWADLRRAAHKLRGSAGVHGFTAIGDLAGAVEELLLSSPQAPEGGARERVCALLEEIRSEAGRAGGEAP